ncbi:DUF6350 family protein [Corynebacterium frankenforstense]|uniref:cell division protein PerM n=1 Tax=Corynebacterium frankenforstense TaxID=1230998 RepID=UPI0026F209FD|nr:DUF6350 family protein [Corynebacterium frankenforstense]
MNRQSNRTPRTAAGPWGARGGRDVRATARSGRTGRGRQRPRRRPRTQPVQEGRPPRSAERVGTRADVATDTARTVSERSWRLPVRLRRKLPTAILPHIVAVLLIVVIAAVTLLVTSTPLSALPASVGSAWLVLNAAPISLDGVALGVVPLVPAILFAWVISRRVHRAVKDRVSLADLGVLTAGVVGLPLGLTLTALFMVYDAASVYPVDLPPVGHAVLATLLVHLGALVTGMRARLWRALAHRFGSPDWLVDAARTAAQFLGLTAGAGLVAWLLGLALHGGEVAEIFASAHGVGEALLIVLITLLYLPNAVISAGAVLLGSEVHAGAASVSLFSVHLVPLPPLPVFSAVPPEMPAWAMVFLLLPALAGAWLAYRRLPDWREALAGAAFAGVFAWAACYLAGGEMGVYGPTGPMAWLAGLLAAVWLGVVGLVAAGLAEIRRRRLADTLSADALAADERAAQDEEDGDEDAEPVDGEVVDEADDDTDAEADEVEDVEADTDADDADPDGDREDTATDTDAAPRGEAVPVSELLDSDADADSETGADAESTPDTAPAEPTEPAEPDFEGFYEDFQEDTPVDSDGADAGEDPQSPQPRD